MGYGRGVPKRKSEDRELSARICKWIRAEAEARKVSQNEIGRRMGIGSGTLSKYMTGERIASVGFLLMAARELKIPSLVQLVFEDPQAKSTAPPPPAASTPPAQARKRRA